MPPSLGKLWGKRSFFSSLAKVGLKGRSSGPVSEVEEAPNLMTLPATKSWELDGGPFITLPLVYTQHPETGGPNLGMYRMHLYDEQHSGMHFQIGKGAGFHFHVAEQKGEALPATVFLGGPPALILSAIAPLPENVPEILLTSLLMGRRLPMLRRKDLALPVPTGCELALVGEVLPKERWPEGPFGDHYGYYSLQHDYPVFRCKKVLRRRDAILPATVVGKPRQEDFFIGDFLQELLSPLFPVVMPAVRDLWSYGETGYHSLSAAVVNERYRREAMGSAFRILGEGQLSLTKFLLVLDRDINLRDFSAVFEHVLARADFRRDLYLFSNLSMDSLDYNGPVVNEGSKGVLLGLGEPIRELQSEFQAAELPQGVSEVAVFCGGCVTASGASFESEPKLAQRVAEHPAFADWPFVVLVDDAAKAAKSDMNFLWTTFTRFEPASDVYAKKTELRQLHPSFEAPIVIDARMKPKLPAELFCDETTRATVDTRWTEYFPQGGVEMGDSDLAHLD